MDSKDMYAPCSCGSGKKYKFCCYQKKVEQAVVSSIAEYWADAPDEDVDPTASMFPGLDEAVVHKSLGICQKGLSLMASGKFEKAIPLFQKAMSLSQAVYTSANNLAACLFVTGKLDEALRVQRKSLEVSPLNNPFGLVNLATFLYIKGDEDEAKLCLDTAVAMKPPSVDACVKVCEGLARFKRHQDILDYVDGGDYPDEPSVCFYAGVAAANLGDRKRAKSDLQEVKLGHPKADRVRRYLEHLRGKSSPQTVLGDWPYLMACEVCPMDVIKAEIAREGDAWLARRIVVDICEVFLNETVDNLDSAMGALCVAKHPEAIKLLWAIAKGSFGSDTLRFHALQVLRERGAIDPKQPVEILMDGKRRELVLTGTRLSSDFRFAPPLPPKWEKVYIKNVQAGTKKNPDWAAMGAVYFEIMNAVPAFYPARYNYAGSLMNQNRVDEAEPILRELVEAHPEYLFASATLLQLFCFQKRMKEAGTFIKAVAVPEETHPDAMVAWLLAQNMYYESAHRPKEARTSIEQARVISPDHPRVKALWELYGE